MKLSDYIAQFLVNQQVTDVFTVTGGGAMHLNDSFGHHKGLRCVYNHHEQACAIAAEGYTRLSGKTALVCVTSGPGGTNAITGVLGGWLDSIPMFVISGQVKRETTIWSTDVPLRQLGDQEFNIVDSVKPMTKYAVMVTEPNKIRYHLEKAWHMAHTGRGGPVWLDIPLDVQAAQIEVDDLECFNPAELSEKPQYNTDTTDKILEKLAQAKRPVILAGTGIRLGAAYDSFLKAIETLGIPVVTAWNAHDLLWDEHPLYCGRPGTIGTRGGNFVVQNSDLLLSLGCRLNIRQISYNFRSFAPDAYKIVVDIDKNELAKPTIHPDMPVHADVLDVLDALKDCKYQCTNVQKDWLERCRTVYHQYPAVLPRHYETEDYMNPYAFTEILSKHLEEGEHIVTGNGSACVVTFQAIKVKPKQRIFTNSGCAAMGYGFPAALGACVADQGKRIICIDGDGSFQMNLQELQTAVYNRFNVKILYLNNNGYSSIRQTQTNLFSPPLVGVCDGNGLSFPDMEKIACAYGIPYVKISTPAQADTGLEKLLTTDGPCLCEVMLDPTQFFEPKLSSKVLPDGSIVSPEIDDMFPFLSRDEYLATRAFLKGEIK